MRWWCGDDDGDRRPDRPNHTFCDRVGIISDAALFKMFVVAVLRLCRELLVVDFLCRFYFITVPCYTELRLECLMTSSVCRLPKLTVAVNF